MLNNPPPGNPAVYEILWKNVIKPGRPQMTIWRMHIAYWIPKTTNTHSEYWILTALPLQQWFHERTSLLRYIYIACLVNNFIILFMELLVAGHCWSDLETAVVRYRQTAAQYLNLHSLLRQIYLSAELSTKPWSNVTVPGSHREEGGWPADAMWTFRSREYLVPYPESNLCSSFCQLVVQSVPKLRCRHSCLHS